LNSLNKDNNDKSSICHCTIIDDLSIDMYDTKLGQTCKRRQSVGFYCVHFTENSSGEKLQEYTADQSPLYSQVTDVKTVH